MRQHILVLVLYIDLAWIDLAWIECIISAELTPMCSPKVGVPLHPQEAVDSEPRVTRVHTVPKLT